MINKYLKIVIISLFCSQLNLLTQELELINPNGEEEFATEDSVLIEWSGASINDTISIEFSSNNGGTWETITESATNNKYKWLVPNIESDSCLIRIENIKDTLYNEGDIIWEKSFGGRYSEKALKSEETDDGGFIVSGTSWSDDGDIINQHGGPDFWTIKLNNLGNLEWSKAYGGSGKEWLGSLTENYSGNYFMCGQTQSDDGDISNPIEGHHDYWMLEIDKTGEILWDYNSLFNQYSVNVASSIIQTLDSGIIITGYARHQYTQFNSYATKFDQERNVQWEKEFGGESEDVIFSIDKTFDGGYVLGGYSRSKSVSNDFTAENYWVIKLNHDGEKLWEKTYGGSSKDILRSIKQTKDGGYIAVGKSNSTDDIDISKNNGNYDIWIIKIDEDGNKEWEKSLGGSKLDEASSIIEVKNQYIICGSTNSNDFDVKNNHGNSDFWIAKINKSGELVWEKNYGGSKNDYGVSISQTTNHNYIVCGSTFSNDKDVSNNNQDENYWVLKIAGQSMMDSDTSDNTFSIKNQFQIYPEIEDGYAGDIKELKLKVKGTFPDTLKNYAYYFNTYLTFNSTILSPAKKSNLIKIDENQNAVIELSGQILNDFVLDSTLLTVGLGNSPSTEISISDFNFLDSNRKSIKTIVNFEKDTFKILGLCLEGGIRLINPNNKVNLFPPKPNVVNYTTILEFEIIESGNTIINLYNNEGKKIRTILNNKLSPGRKSIHLNLGNLSSGRYFINLITPTVIKTESLKIVK